MRQSMEAYLSKIKNIHIVYEENWDEPKPDGPLFRVMSEKLERQRQRVLHAASPLQRLALERKFQRGRPKFVRQIDLIDAYPSLRLDTKERRTFPDGSTVELRTLQFVHEGRITDIDLTHNSVIEKKLERISVLENQPAFALGRRLRGTLNQPVSTLLELPEVTALEGTEEIHGTKTVVIKVGPPLPASHRPAGASERDWVRLWLGPSYSHLPIRADYHQALTAIKGVDEVVHRTELADFQPARDEMRDEQVLFPRLLTYDQPGGKIEWRVSRVVLNEAVPADTFRASIPTGFLVTRDGVVPTVRLSGGREAQQRIVSETVKSAADMLAQSPPARSTDVSWPMSPRVLVPLGFLAVLVGLFFLRRRSHVA